ncbi:MAG: hypothetical protein JOZ87_28255 [Chloroflexi bacterium]|nr:hypothetical protein [Chloroflexota bacterium]
MTGSAQARRDSQVRTVPGDMPVPAWLDELPDAELARIRRGLIRNGGVSTPSGWRLAAEIGAILRRRRETVREAGA